MKNTFPHKIILWDFDGVIMDSMPIRDKGFVEVLNEYPKEQVDELMDFHRRNGGLSRYVKFRYFFEEIRNENVSNEIILDFSNKFSKIMLQLLINESLLIEEVVSFIKENAPFYEMHIVSGSDERELRIICDALGLTRYFHSINGSPTAKKKIVEDLLIRYNYKKENVVLIGDSLNDFEAAKYNNITFFGYNNALLKEVSDNYLENLV